MRLNPITKTSGPCIILAGAGTGKTYNIIEKIKYMIEKNLYKPAEILCLTFSNEATNELKNRLAEAIKESSQVTIKTFHAFCSEILKEEGELVGLDEDFEILLPDDAKVLFHRSLDITPYWANRYVATISSAMDFGITLTDMQAYVHKVAEQFKNIKNVEEYAEKIDFELKTLHLNPSDTVEQRRKIKQQKAEILEFLTKYNEYQRFKNFVSAWEGYTKLKREKKYLDYADLNHYTLKLFRMKGADKYAKRFKYIFVDEFQDTNKLQFELIELLGAKHKNITIVGDPNQSIYGFRGAYKDSFDHFKRVFDITRNDEFTLDKSRRSPNKVLRIAHQLIKKNWEKPEDCPFIENYERREGEQVECYQMLTADEEARKIAELVEEEIHQGASLQEIAVLFRTHKQGKIIQAALEAKGIPFISAGELDLLAQPEIKTVISYLSILNNLRERTGTGEQAWWNLFHYHNTLSPEDSIKIGRYLKQKKKESEVSIDEVLLTALDKLQLSKSGEEIVHKIIGKLKELLKESKRSLPQLVLAIYELIGLNRAFSYERTAGNIEAMMNLREFYKLAENYHLKHGRELSSFISYLEVLSELGVNVPASRVQDVNAVRLMTIHATKGLQFDTVIVSNLAEKRFPITRTRNEPLIPKELLPEQRKILSELKEGDEPEEAIREYERMVLLVEERRLCYVAFTRTKKRLVLTYAASYNEEENSAVPSTFLQEIDFNKNPDITVINDKQEKSLLYALSSRFEQFKSLLKKQLIESLDSEDLQSLFSRLVSYHALREGKVEPVNINSNLNYEQMKINLAMFQERKSGLQLDPQNFVFSPTSLLEYNECPKKYELSKILQMPSVGDFEWSGAATGSFIHKLLEDGVHEKFSSLKQFVDLSKEMAELPEWEGVDLKEIENLLKIFWARHEGQYDENSLVEEKLPLKIDGFSFFGIADRIDMGKEGVTIIDYKTNGSALDSTHRSWQLGYYALAAQAKGWKVKKLVLEMLRLEKPVEMTVVGDEVKGPDGRTKGFTLTKVKKELVETAKKIVHDYENEFKVVEDDAPCRFCGLKFYCPKWGNGK